MRAWRWLGFMALCLWQATSWLVPPMTDGPSVLEKLVLACAMAAVVAGIASVVQREKLAGIAWRQTAAAAVLLVGAPAVLLIFASDHATDTAITSVFALTPCVVMLVWAATSSEQRALSALVPALVSAGGVLLILPYGIPSSAATWKALAMVALAMLLTASGAVWLHRLIRGRSLAVSILLVAVANVIFLAPFEWGRGSGWHLAGVPAWGVIAAQGAELVLVVWLSGAISPVQFSSRFLVVPLLTILEGAVLVRPALDVRFSVGMLLVAVGAGWLMVRGRRVEDEVLSLR